MLDMNRLFGFVFYARDSGIFTAIKYALIESTTSFDTDDAAIVMGEYKQGSGAITAEIMNCPPLSTHAECLDRATAVATVFSELDINSPKKVLIVTDDFAGHTAFEIHKMRLFNEKCPYPSELHVIQIHPTIKNNNQWLVVKNVKQLGTEVKKIIEGTNVD